MSHSCRFTARFLLVTHRSAKPPCGCSHHQHNEECEHAVEPGVARQSSMVGQRSGNARSVRHTYSKRPTTQPVKADVPASPATFPNAVALSGAGRARAGSHIVRVIRANGLDGDHERFPQTAVGRRTRCVAHGGPKPIVRDDDLCRWGGRRPYRCIRSMRATRWSSGARLGLTTPSSCMTSAARQDRTPGRSCRGRL